MPEAEGFVLAAGGKFHELMCRLGFRSPARRALLLIAVAWLPLEFLAWLLSPARTGGDPLAALKLDLSTHARLLFALPLLALAEMPVDRQVGHTVSFFVREGLIGEESLPAFDAAVADAKRRRDRPLVELLLFLLAYLAVAVRMSRTLKGFTSPWMLSGDGTTLSAAGEYLIWVGRPLLRFMEFRWFWRIAIWTVLLIRIARLPLKLHGTHPDRAGGLAFLSIAQGAFATVALPFSTTWAAAWRDLLLGGGASTHSVELGFIGWIGFSAILFAGPAVVFLPRLFYLRHAAVRRYGVLGTRYVSDFERRWIDGTPPDRELLGTQDIQALADLSTSYRVLDELRLIPLDKTSLIGILVATALPMLLLAGFILPLDKILSGVFRWMG